MARSDVYRSFSNHLAHACAMLRYASSLAAPRDEVGVLSVAACRYSRLITNLPPTMKR